MFDVIVVTQNMCVEYWFKVSRFSEKNEFSLLIECTYIVHCSCRCLTEIFIISVTQICTSLFTSIKWAFVQCLSHVRFIQNVVTLIPLLAKASTWKMKLTIVKEKDADFVFRHFFPFHSFEWPVQFRFYGRVVSTHEFSSI